MTTTEPTPERLQSKPLFIPLKREFFEAFEAGTKTEEFRQHGARWNERTCSIGRAVTLSLGYGRQRRIHGIVTGFRTAPAPLGVPAGWIACYGSEPSTAACIRIDIATGGAE